jgi:hypothetical protein
VSKDFENGFENESLRSGYVPMSPAGTNCRHPDFYYINNRDAMEAAARHTQEYRQIASLLAANAIRQMRATTISSSSSLVPFPVVDPNTRAHSSTAPVLLAHKMQPIMTKDQMNESVEPFELDHETMQRDVPIATALEVQGDPCTAFSWKLAAVEVAQYFLHSNQTVQHPGFVPANLVPRVVVAPLPLFSAPPRATTTASATTTTAAAAAAAASRASCVANAAAVVLLPICRECGGPLQPGIVEHTTVRLVRLSKSTTSARTARRRASRNRARQERRKCAMAFTSLPLSSNKIQQQQQERSNLWHYVQEPELSKATCHYGCKNLLVIACGWCGHESTRPGIAWPKPNRRQPVAPNHSRHSRAAAAKLLPHHSTARHGNLPLTTKAKPRCSITPSTNHLMVPVEFAETVPDMVPATDAPPLDDFVSLPPLPSSNHDGRPSTAKASSGNSRPPLGGGILQPKRKKAKKGTNKSALLNFLSSLND